MSYGRKLMTLAVIFLLVALFATALGVKVSCGGWELPQGTLFWRVMNGALTGLFVSGTVNAISFIVRFARGKGGLAVLIGLAAFCLSPFLCAVGTFTVLPYMVYCIYKMKKAADDAAQWRV